jgi:hypothetical protein
MTRMVALMAVAAMAVVTSAAPALAAGYSKAVTSKCRADYKRLCPSYKVDSDALRACMRANHRAISNRCMNALVDAGEAPQTARRR